MSAPTLDRHPGSSQAGSSEGRRRRRKQLVLVRQRPDRAGPGRRDQPGPGHPAGGPPGPRRRALAATEDQNANTDQGQTGTQGQNATGTAGGPGRARRDRDRDRRAGPARRRHHRLHHQGDAASDRIVVDVVQVFHDDQAVKAAIADGKTPVGGQVPDGLGPQREPAAAHPAPGRRPRRSAARRVRRVRQQPHRQLTSWPRTPSARAPTTSP